MRQGRQHQERGRHATDLRLLSFTSLPRDPHSFSKAVLESYAMPLSLDRKLSMGQTASVNQAPDEFHSCWIGEPFKPTSQIQAYRRRKGIKIQFLPVLRTDGFPWPLLMGPLNSTASMNKGLGTSWFHFLPWTSLWWVSKLPIFGKIKSKFIVLRPTQVKEKRDELWEECKKNS